MKVLIACEFSGIVREAFKSHGLFAYSCDLLPTEIPGLHYQGDIRDLLDGWMPIRFQADCDPEGNGFCETSGLDGAECPCIGPTQDGVEYKEVSGVLLGRWPNVQTWDLMVAFPPCTYLCSSGMHWTVRGLRDKKLTEDALDFVRLLLAAPIPKIALENPIGCISSRIRKPDQIIQPWQFGEDASKATCLWLKGLPPLLQTMELPGGRKVRRANQCANGQNKLGPSPTRALERSKTYPGIAAAMAEQWT